jgi:hypothetical protein
MNNYINFEDNIFILRTKIRNISDLLSLEADPSFFLKKTMEDLNFISNTIKLLLEKLTSNKQLITKDEQLHNLNEAIEIFLDVLSNILRGSACFSIKNCPNIEADIRALVVLCNNQTQSIDKLVSKIDVQNIDHRVVSTDELSELLKDIS